MISPIGMAHLQGMFGDFQQQQQHGNSFFNGLQSNQISSIEDQQRKLSKNETIHSGHFMVSEIDDADPTGQQAQAAHESDYEQAEQSVSPDQLIDYDLESACQETTQTYIYGPRSTNIVHIDASLSKLFECMTLAYCGKLTTPKWKTFKGLRLKLKDKIRLNNIIWRAWHIQYVSGRKTPVCQFSSFIDVDAHNKPEAIVLEGKYWKRRLATVTNEYKKWRMYHKEKTKTKPFRMSVSWINDSRWPEFISNSDSMPGSCSQYDDDFMDFSDTALFNSLLPPTMIDFPNPREIARAGMGAEFIQPGLTQLQPSLEDFMDTFEPFQDFLLPSKSASILPPLPEEPTETNLGSKTSNQKQQISSNNEFSSFYEQSMRKGNQSTTMIKNINRTAEKVSQFTQPLQEPMKDLGKELNEPQIPFNQVKSLNTLNNDNLGEISQQVNANLSVQVPSQPVTEQTRIVETEPPIQLYQNDVSMSYCNYSNMVPITQKETVKTDYNTSDNQTTNPQFVVPKQIPLKQRSRSRSISTPQSPKLKNITSIPTQPVMSLVDLQIPPKLTTHQSVERSSSLPLFTNKRRHNIISQTFRGVNAGQPIQSEQLNVQNSINRQQPLSQTQITSNVQQQQQQQQQQQSYSNYSNESGSSLIAHLLSTTNVPTNTSRSLPNNLETNRSPNIAMHSVQFQPVFQAISSNIVTENNSGVVNFSNPIMSQSNSDISVLTTNGPQQTMLVSPTFRLSNGNLTQNFLVQNSPVRKMSSPSRFSPTIQSIPSPGDTPVSSPQSSVASPSATNKNYKPKSDEERIQYKEHRRVCHINAEQKRRCNIKNGFDTLKTILPSINQNCTTKLSKAAMLQKAADYIRTLKSERQQQVEEIGILKQQIESLNNTIGVFQNQLPATGAPVSCQRTGHLRESYESYVRQRTSENWKFWIFSIMMESILESYNNTVSTANVDEMCKSVLRWMEQSCTLVTLRRDVLNSLRYLSTSTNILSNPSSLSQEALAAVTKKEKDNSQQSQIEKFGRFDHKDDF